MWEFQGTCSTSKQFFEATLSGSFQGVRITSVTSRWSCSLPDKSNCWSLKTRFHEVTSEFKRLDAVNDTLHNWFLQDLSPEKSSHIHGCVLYALDAELSWCSRVQAHQAAQGRPRVARLFPNGSGHALPIRLLSNPKSRTRGSRGFSFHLSCLYVLSALWA